MRSTEKVVLVEAALGLILPADRASSPPLPRMHTHEHILTLARTLSSWPGLDTKDSSLNFQVTLFWSWKIPDMF